MRVSEVTTEGIRIHRFVRTADAKTYEKRRRYTPIVRIIAIYELFAYLSDL